MKLSREDLKSLIKECIVEIFSETANLQESKKQYNTNISGKSVSKPNRVISNNALQQKRHIFSDAVKTVAGGDPLMESILADTAKTTLPTMLANGDSLDPVSTAQIKPELKEHFNGDPATIFGEGAMNWEKLAFSSDKKQKS